MAHFYGTVKGKRHTQEASRLGDQSSGLRTEACSWQGKVVTYLYSANGIDFARVSLQPHNGEGTMRLLYDGPVSGRSNEQLAEQVA